MLILLVVCEPHALVHATLFSWPAAALAQRVRVYLAPTSRAARLPSVALPHCALSHAVDCVRVSGISHAAQRSRHRRR
jgi:hypothetical protein